MGFFGIRVCKLEIFTNHFERGMTQEALQGEDIAAITKVLDGEGVAKFVGVG